jgi:hypothetical protein
MNKPKAMVAITANIESIRVRGAGYLLLRGCKVAALQPLPLALRKGVMDMTNKLMGAAGKQYEQSNDHPAVGSRTVDIKNIKTTLFERDLKNKN